MTDIQDIERRTSLLSVTLENRLFLAFAVMLFAVAVLLRLASVLTTQVVITDERTSLLIATGHAEEFIYQNGEIPFPVAEWVSAQEWQRYLEVEQGSDIRSVFTDLWRTDIHPPVYFLLLRIWTQLFGNAYTTGKLLSFLLDLVAVALLAITARTFLPGRDSGWLVALIWIISPIAILGGATIRPYSLLTIWVILFTLLLGKYLLQSQGQTNKRILVLGLLATSILGLLTHLVFALVLCAAFVTILLNNRESRHWFIIPPLFLIMISVLFVELLLPQSLLLQTYLLPKVQSLGFQDKYFVRYLRRSFMLLLSLSIPLGVFLVTYVYMLLPNRPISIDTAPNLRALLRFLLTMLIVTYGLHSVLYLTGVFYPYTVSDHHLLYLTPLVALIATGLLQLIPRTNIGSLATIGLLVGLFLIPAVRMESNLGITSRTIDLHQLSNYDTVVVDLVNRPELFTYLNPDSLVFATYQPDLIDRRQDWLQNLISKGGIYVSLLETGPNATGNAEGRDQILSMIAEKGSVQLLGSTTEQGTTVSVYQVGK